MTALKASFSAAILCSAMGPFVSALVSASTTAATRAMMPRIRKAGSCFFRGVLFSMG